MTELKNILKVYTNSYYFWFMKILSLKLDDDVFESTERLTAELGCKRNRYINDALRWYNAHNERKMIKEALSRESRLTRAESIQVLKEFEQLEKGSTDAAV